MTTPYDRITDLIVAKLKQGVIPWKKPWRVEAPKNFVSKKPYRGINALILGTQDEYACPFWLTYKQTTELGGYVKKGEKGTPIVFWKFFDNDNEDLEDNEVQQKRPPLLRYYTVFNLEQTTIEVPKQNKVVEKPTCQSIVDNMPNKPEISHGGNKAFYAPTPDLVKIPHMSTFESSDYYYATLFHELSHSTGHKSRLNRKTVTEKHEFGSEDYSKEELIAEISAAFLCGVTGIEKQTVENSAAYVQNWLEKLQNDNRLIVCAAAQAQKSADYILGKQN